MAGVCIDEFTHVGSLIGTLFDYVAVVLKKMIYEEFVELFMWTLTVFVDLSR